MTTTPPPTTSFALTPEQRAWCAQLRTLGTERLAPLVTEGEAGRVNRTLLRALGELGLLARAVPGAPPWRRVAALDLCLLRESLAYSCPEAETALALQGLGAGPVADVGTAEQRARWLPAVAAGEAVAAFALSEPDAGSDAAALALRAEPEARSRNDMGGTGATGGTGGWRLTGTKTWISNAPWADFYTVFARTGEAPGSRGVTAFLVPADRPGLSGRPLDMLAPHALGTLTFDAVPVTRADRLGEPGAGFRVAMRTLNLFRPSVGAFAVGMAQAALDASLAHAGRRPAFGGVLRDLQAVSHQLAEMATRTEAARLLVYAAACAYDSDEAGGNDVALRAAMAKLLATETAQYVVDAAVQIHGAAALQRGHLLEHLYREVRAPRIYEGASEVQRTLIAKELYKEKEKHKEKPEELYKETNKEARHP
ncbi:acyl-CoA dehydrogenase family protein [Streptomyces spirodelae]|uniref:Acyl-CoA dehydrogenase family protein n=1 Tax=Streptomyces spirodelae TaxID=2812904 RepID=A0ABS3WRL5_9ACTN|nr:acyl-CoA dehydrogenase family protein [Streptomyces spirodelae]MBO8185497.1 acyl-CoA dehydrogenase family protein [Streptomyces spirodelae]